MEAKNVSLYDLIANYKEIFHFNSLWGIPQPLWCVLKGFLYCPILQSRFHFLRNHNLLSELTR